MEEARKNHAAEAPQEPVELAARVRALSNKVSELEHLLEIASVLASSHLSLDAKLERSLELICGQFGAKRGSIMIVDERKKEIAVRAAIPAALVGQRQPMEGDGVAAWVVRQRLALNVENAEEFRQCRTGGAHSHAYDNTAFLALPVMGQAGPVGVVSITERREGPFSPADEEAMARFIDRIAVTIENAALYDRLKHDEEDLRAAHLRLVQLEHMKEDLMRMIVHDLKGPIHEVTGNLSMLLQGETLNDFEHELILSAKAGTESLIQMVMDILDVSRMEEGVFTLSRRNEDIAALVNRKAEALGPLLRLSGKSLGVECNAASFAFCDPEIVTRVLANLLNNAINYSPEEENITVRIDRLGGLVRIGVVDKGPGIPPELRERLFDKFEQVEGDRQRSKYSTGLGLTFCKMAVEAHGGSIWIEENPGGGSVFCFTLPAAAEGVSG